MTKTASWTRVKQDGFREVRNGCQGTFLNYVHESLVVKNLPAKAGDIREPSSIPGLGRSPGEGNVNTLQYSCLENPMDGGAWWATVHGVAELDTTE